MFTSLKNLWGCTTNNLLQIPPWVFQTAAEFPLIAQSQLHIKRLKGTFSVKCAYYSIAIQKFDSTVTILERFAELRKRKKIITTEQLNNRNNVALCPLCDSERSRALVSQLWAGGSMCVRWLSELLRTSLSSHQTFKRLLCKMSRCTLVLTWRRWSKMGHVTWSGVHRGAKNPGRGGEREEQKRQVSIKTFTAFWSI